jgi:hypothetical protein
MNITGTIKDAQTGNAINDAKVQEVYYEADNNLLTPIGNIFSAPGGNYSLTVDNLSSDQYFQFTAPGYNLYYANDISLASNPNVLLLKEPVKTGEILFPLALLALIMTKKKATMGKLQTKDVYPYLLIGGVLVVTGALKKMLTSLGILTSADTTALDTANTNPESFWNPDFWRQFTSFPNGSLTQAEAVQMLSEIDASFGVISDNVAQVTGVFKKLTSQAEVSYLSYMATKISNTDLLTYLRGGTWPNDRLSDSEVQSINLFLSKLPTN